MKKLPAVLVQILALIVVLTVIFSIGSGLGPWPEVARFFFIVISLCGSASIVIVNYVENVA